MSVQIPINVTVVSAQPQVYSILAQSASQAGTVTVISGVQAQQIRVLSYALSASAGQISLQDSTGVVVCQPASSAGSTGITELPRGADLQVVLSAPCTFTAYVNAIVA